MNQEEHSRRQHKRPAKPKGHKTLITLLLLLNTSVLICLLFLNFQSYNQSERQETHLNTVEYKVDALAKGLATKQIPSSSSDSSSQSSIVTQETEQTNELNSSSEENLIAKEEQETPPSSSSHEEVTPPTTQRGNTNYTVKNGDTLSSIAEQNNMTVADLMSKNNLTDSTVFVGQELSLK